MVVVVVVVVVMTMMNNFVADIVVINIRTNSNSRSASSSTYHSLAYSVPQTSCRTMYIMSGLCLLPQTFLESARPCCLSAFSREHF